MATCDMHGSLTQFFALQALSCKLFATGVFYAHVNNLSIAAGLIQPTGVTAHVHQALHLMFLF